MKNFTVKFEHIDLDSSTRLNAGLYTDQQPCLKNLQNFLQIYNCSILYSVPCLPDRRIRMFLGLPDPLVTSTDPDPDSSIFS